MECGESGVESAPDFSRFIGGGDGDRTSSILALACNFVFSL